jgi:hypothetical protein
VDPGVARLARWTVSGKLPFPSMEKHPSKSRWRALLRVHGQVAREVFVEMQGKEPQIRCQGRHLTGTMGCCIELRREPDINY